LDATVIFRRSICDRWKDDDEKDAKTLQPNLFDVLTAAAKTDLPPNVQTAPLKPLVQACSPTHRRTAGSSRKG